MKEQYNKVTHYIVATKHDSTVWYHTGVKVDTACYRADVHDPIQFILYTASIDPKEVTCSECKQTWEYIEACIEYGND